jgi:phosphoribosyl 1,2-cyclic phosphate phosphodiesterase
LKITFLGTGTSQGVPVIACSCNVCTSSDFQDKRLRTSIFIEVDGTHIVVDTGPDFRQQMLRERINKLDAVLFTHEHKDHTAGMDDIRSFNFAQKMDMPIYARPTVLEQLQREFAYIFANSKYPGVPRVQMMPINDDPFLVNDIIITPIEVMHYKLPVYGFRVGDFTYITDANYISDASLEKIKGTKVLVLNALQINSHISHFTLDEAIQMVDKVGAEKAYFTHISHNLGRHRLVTKKLPSHISLAYDGLTLNV